MVFSFTTHKGLGKYINNQDYIGHLEKGSSKLFVVCDGIGGFSNGEKYSKCAVDNILKTFLNTSGSPKSILSTALSNAHSEILNISKNLSGTTVVAVIIKNNNAWCAWCGDSRIYHLKNKTFSWISKDHNVLYDLMNTGKLVENISLNPRALTRFLGKKNGINPDFYKIEFHNDDFLLLCSDGLTDFIDEDILINTIVNNTPKVATKLLQNYLLNKKINAPDNFSWYIIKF